MVRKRDSKRRWKKRALCGRLIPREAIENHGLWKWFEFVSVSPFSEMYIASEFRDGSASASFNEGIGMYGVTIARSRVVYRT